MSSNEKIILVFAFAVFFTFFQSYRGEESPLYKFVVHDINGKSVSLGEYKGKVLLFVNVASECGYTDSHYKELVNIQDEFASQGFTVLAFPCNQFGHQEPNDEQHILKFAKERYKVNFPIFSKIDVGGEHAHPLYVYLYKATYDYPKWNFGKYLVDRSGKVVKFFSQKITPRKVVPFIELLVQNKSLESFHTDL